MLITKAGRWAILTTVVLIGISMTVESRAAQQGAEEKPSVDSSEPTEPPSPQQKVLDREKLKLRKKIESSLKGKKGEVFLVGLSETSFHTMLTMVKEGSVEVRLATEGRFLSAEKAEFSVHEGKDAAVEFLMEKLTPFIRLPAKKGSEATPGEEPPSEWNWKVLGRFKTVGEAEAALRETQAAYDAQPRWEGGRDDEGDKE
jgi:hypothetical protein